MCPQLHPPHHSFPSIARVILMNLKWPCLIASVPSFAAGRRFSPWTGRPVQTGSGGTRAKLKSASLLDQWRGRGRKALAGGFERAKELSCSFILLPPPGSEMDYNDILPFLLELLEVTPACYVICVRAVISESETSFVMASS